MLKQSELSEDEQAEAFRRADALFRAESEQARVAKAAAAAAEELGIPQEYLDRAAAQVHAEKVERIQAQNRRKRTLLAVGLALVPAALAIFLMGQLLSRSQPAPPSVLAPRTASDPFTLSLAQKDSATTSFENANIESTTTSDSYSLNIKDFQLIQGNYQANVGFSLGRPIPGYKQVSFVVHSQGISSVRVDLRDGSLRWNSSPISISPASQRVTIPLSTLNRQTRYDGATWKSATGPGPDTAKSLVFKFGKEINPPSAKGTVTISDVRFE